MIALSNPGAVGLFLPSARSRALPPPSHQDLDFAVEPEPASTSISEVRYPDLTTRGLLPSSAADLSAIITNLDLDSAERSPHGTGGVYFVSDSMTHERRAVYKPQSEENDTTGQKGYLKEFAAFVIDNGLACVPETTIVSVERQHLPVEIGSVQAYVAESEDAEDFGPGIFNTEDIHRIGILDVRILNCDRHSGNLMRNKKTGKLVPIDHGSAFPSVFDGGLANVSFEWLMYPQARQPFSAELLDVIANLDVNADIEKLNTIGVDEGAQIANWMSTTLLKLGADAGLTLHDIGSMVQRAGDRSAPSILEDLFHRAVAACVGTDYAEFFDNFAGLAKQHIACI
mmetsp:Transcript_2901/g.7251  ORF Transcript_2901/g.7251 Transcript_2901/m.7251 type:complete len:342 (-) Transcript_2901:1049-2074(-)